jgi:hypothetical protein
MVSTVRVSLLARSLRRDLSNDTVSAKPDLDLNDSQPNSGSLDGRHRRAARTEVALRNAMGAAEMRLSGW